MSRWTMKQLEEMSDLEIIRDVLGERKHTCTNYYSPLYKKLTGLQHKVDIKIRKGKRNI